MMMMMVVLMINENQLDDNNDRTEETNRFYKCLELCEKLWNSYLHIYFHDKCNKYILFYDVVQYSYLPTYIQSIPSYTHHIYTSINN